MMDRGNEAMSNAVLLSKLGTNVKTLAGIIRDELFGGSFVFVLCLAVVLILVLLKKRGFSRQQTDETEKGKGKDSEICVADKTKCILQYAIIGALNCLVVFQVAPYKNSRYIFNIYPIIILCAVYSINKCIGTLTLHKRKGIVLFGLFAVLMIVSGYMKTGVKYLYSGDKERIEKLEQYSDVPAIFVLKRNYRMKSAELVYYWRVAPCVFPVREQNLNVLADNLPNSKQFVLYIDDDYTHEERKRIIKRIMKITKTKNSELLFRENYSKIWLIE